MAHLYRPRIGWESERLAQYLLSRFSFVAQPTTVADDLGSDFFCTIFDIIQSPVRTVAPRGSFAIQVKSSKRPISAHNKVAWLHHLEMPFLIGVMRQSPPQMALYSAELLPMLFAQFGIPQKLWLCPVPMEEYDPKRYCEGEDAVSGVRLQCPYISTFSANEDRDSLHLKVEALDSICKRAASNIVSTRAGEHIYEIDGEGHLGIIAGCGSAQYFRNNFCKRLAEIFCNLRWIYDNQRGEFRIDEFRLYEALYNDLQKFPPEPTLDVVSRMYKELKTRLDQAN